MTPEYHNKIAKESIDKVYHLSNQWYQAGFFRRWFIARQFRKQRKIAYKNCFYGEGSNRYEAKDESGNPCWFRLNRILETAAMLGLS